MFFVTALMIMKSIVSSLADVYDAYKLQFAVAHLYNLLKLEQLCLLIFT